MNLVTISLLNGDSFTVGINGITEILMVGSKNPTTIIYSGDKVRAYIPYHAVAYWIEKN